MCEFDRGKAITRNHLPSNSLLDETGNALPQSREILKEVKNADSHIGQPFRFGVLIAVAQLLLFSLGVGAEEPCERNDNVVVGLC